MSAGGWLVSSFQGVRSLFFFIKKTPEIVRRKAMGGQKKGSKTNSQTFFFAPPKFAENVRNCPKSSDTKNSRNPINWNELGKVPKFPELGKMEDLETFAKSFPKKEKFSFRDLNAFLGNYKEKDSVKAVLTPSAQTNSLCEVGSQEPLDLSALYCRIEGDGLLSEELKMLIFFQSELGLRISECLNIKFSEINSQGSVLLESLKGSENQVVSCSLARNYLLRCRARKQNPFETYNRFFLYRLYKKLGISYRKNGMKKTAVTHAFRHIQADAIREITKDRDILAQRLRHKNPKNSDRYGKK